MLAQLLVEYFKTQDDTGIPCRLSHASRAYDHLLSPETDLFGFGPDETSDMPLTEEPAPEPAAEPQPEPFRSPSPDDYNHVRAPSPDDYNHIRAPSPDDYNHIRSPSPDDYNHIRAPSPDDYANTSAFTHAPQAPPGQDTSESYYLAMNTGAAPQQPQEEQSNYEDMSGINAPQAPESQHKPVRYENWTLDGSPLRAHSYEQERQIPMRERTSSLGNHSLALPPGRYPPVANSAFSSATMQGRMGSPTLTASDQSMYMNQEAIDAQEHS